MKSCKYTDFGLCVKTELLKRGMEQRDLIQLVSQKTGMFMDNAYMHKILTGQRNPQKIIQCIRKMLDIPEQQDTT